MSNNISLFPIEDLPIELSIKQLLSGENYVIPMYQRNYAWEEEEITQIIQDIIDYSPQERNYYIGTLVVFEPKESKRGNYYETIDGQQRLTTLSLLASYIKNNMQGVDWYKELKISFESREHSRKTLSAIFNGEFENGPPKILRENDINRAILNGYQLIKKILPQKLKEHGISFQKFAEFLFTKVRIIQVKVPQDTELNHYFEIMNNRGEQLEQHEILKSRLLEVFNKIDDIAERKKSQNCLHWVWEACANMEKYVQVGFSTKTKQRNQIFGENWGTFNVDSFDALCNLSKEDSSDSGNTQSIDEIIEDKANAKRKDQDNRNDESPERFNSVINFPNFLLHVLRVYDKNENVPLDDKKLIPAFEEHILKIIDPTDPIEKLKQIEKVKQFTFALLKCKYLFDRYVIKREFIGTDDRRWSLKRFQCISGSESGDYVNTFGDDDDNEDKSYNRRILMLLAAFHVSAPTQVYKYWLNAALHYLYCCALNIKAESYLKYLESIAKAFVFDRFLAVSKDENFFYGNNGTCWLWLCSGNRRFEYSEIIYENKGKYQATLEKLSTWEKFLESKLSFGQIENNFIFNYLDYLLWLKHKEEDSRVKSYEFTFRSSVEHYYPQNPKPGFDPLPPNTLNSFGNLCLISHSKNSILNNDTPEQKKGYYRKNTTIDSIKQYLMMDDKKYPADWNSRSIEEHYQEMECVLIESLNP